MDSVGDPGHEEQAAPCASERLADVEARAESQSCPESPSSGNSPPHGAFEEFAEACDSTRNVRAAARLLVWTGQSLNFQQILLSTHGNAEELGSLAVSAHNCSTDIVAKLRDGEAGAHNPFFEQAEHSEGLVYWNAPRFRAALGPKQRAWMERLAEAGLKDGVSQIIRSSVAPASLTLAPDGGEAQIGRVRWMMRAGAYALHHMIALQRPQLAPSESLTLREQQCLALATLQGLRPRDVAETLGVSINTVRTMRQSACARLHARSQEEAVWRMVETGQLFARGRVSRPRSW